MSWTNLYIVLALTGLVILFLNVVFDIFDWILDFDFFDIDIGDFDLAIIPLSIRSICLMLCLFGSICLLLGDENIIFRHIVAGIIAYIAGVISQTVYKYLKKHQITASDKELWLLCKSIVTSSIPEGGYGCISVERDNDSRVNITAKGKNGIAIKQGVEVKVIEIFDNYVVVDIL